MTTYSQGEVVLVPFPFTDLSTQKVRPALIVSANWVNQTGQDIVIAAITSNIPSNLRQDEYQLSSSDLGSAGLPKPSIVKMSKLVTAHKRLIIKSIGTLPDQTLEDILEGIQNIFSK